MLEDALHSELIYKYSAPRLDLLKSTLIRFTQPNGLNDPFEARPRLLMDSLAPEDIESARAEAKMMGLSPDLPREQLEALFLRGFPAHRMDERSFPGLWPCHLPALREEPFESLGELDRFRADEAAREFMDAASKELGILCLTEDGHSQLMWAHYACSHSGVLLTFHREHAFFKEGMGLHRVEYAPRRVAVTSKDGLFRICGVRFEDAVPLPLRAFLRKHPVWSHEVELRMMRALSESVAQRLDKPDVYLFPVPPTALAAIVLGARASAEYVAAVRAILSSDGRWSHVRLFEAILDGQEMALNYEETEMRRGSSR